MVGKVRDEGGLVRRGVAGEGAQVPHAQRAVVAAAGQHEGGHAAPGDDVHIGVVGLDSQLRRRARPEQANSAAGLAEYVSLAVAEACAVHESEE